MTIDEKFWKLVAEKLRERADQTVRESNLQQEWGPMMTILRWEILRDIASECERNAKQ